MKLLSVLLWIPCARDVCIPSSGPANWIRQTCWCLISQTGCPILEHEALATPPRPERSLFSPPTSLPTVPSCRSHHARGQCWGGKLSPHPLGEDSAHGSFWRWEALRA